MRRAVRPGRVAPCPVDGSGRHGGRQRACALRVLGGGGACWECKGLSCLGRAASEVGGARAEARVSCMRLPPLCPFALVAHALAASSFCGGPTQAHILGRLAYLSDLLQRSIGWLRSDGGLVRTVILESFLPEVRLGLLTRRQRNIVMIGPWMSFLPPLR